MAEKPTQTRYLLPEEAVTFINEIVRPIHFSGTPVFATLEHMKTVPHLTILDERDGVIYKLRNPDIKN